MHVIVDDREAKSGVVDCLEKMSDTSYSIQRLSIGDYLVDGKLLFERKTIRDFVISLSDGRLFNQSCRLLSSPYRSVFVLEGNVSNSKTNVRREAIQGAIIALTVVLGIPLLRSFGPEETAHLLLYASHQMHRDTSVTVHRQGYRPKGKRKRQLYIVQGLPGIGPIRADKLLIAFGSIKAVFNASQLELSRVPGIGAKMAKQIHTLIN